MTTFDTTSDDREPDETGELESVLARCIESMRDDGGEAIERACAEHPHLAARLRDRLGFLMRSGLLGAGAGRTSLGPYRIEGTLGRGAMGVVYAAIDERSGRRVAVKTSSLSDVDGSTRARERFLREARAASRLHHPHIVPVLDVGEIDGVLFYAMEPIEGVTLAHLIQELRAAGRDPSRLDGDDLRAAWARVRGDAERSETEPWGAGHVAVACGLIRDVARALAHAHSNGVVHRDVKPSNILVDARGRPHLFDFGLAHDQDAPALTRTGEFTGSPRYASLEQVSEARHRVDGRTDVYSLGVTLFELLTLRVPFDADNAADLIRQIQLEDPPPLRTYTSLPAPSLQTVCTTALHKERERRYPTAALFADDLDRALAGREIAARSVGPFGRLAHASRRRPVLSALLALLIVVSVGAPVALLVFNRKLARERDQARGAAADYRREARRNAEVAEFWEQLTLDLESGGVARCRSPDGRDRLGAHSITGDSDSCSTSRPSCS